jgi:tripartite-type tricarboxylate transporter receptor subunit TctC
MISTFGLPPNATAYRLTWSRAKRTVATVLWLTPVTLTPPVYGQSAAVPGKSLRIVLGFSPGGSSDILARMLAPPLGEALGTLVIIDNRPGAGGNIAAELVAKSAPDGSTLLLGNQGVLATNLSLYAKLSYDPVRDFSPIVLLASQPSIMAIHPSLPARSVKEFVMLAKRRAGELNYASSGVGAATHLAGELFCAMAGVRMVHIPYKGAPQALTDVMAGLNQVMFASVTSVMPQVGAGRLRALGVTDTRRLHALPDLPTVAEAGLPGYEARAWHGLVGPAGTPGAVVARLNMELNKIVQGADARDKLAAVGVEVIGGSAQEFAQYIRSEIPKWSKIIKTLGARAE